MFTEMLSAEAMRHNSKKTEDMTIREKEERLVFAQIFGKDPFVMAEAVKNNILSHFEGIDINMGCPAPKIIKNGEGSALLKDLNTMGCIISECVKAAKDRPVSVKVRLGYDKVDIAQIIRVCEEAGASFVSVHGRTFAQGFSGSVDYDAIALAKAVSHIPIIGNGDVVDEESYQKMKQTQVDGVMIGRGAVGSPWIFSLIKGKKVDEMDMIFRHVEILREHYPEAWLNKYLRKHFLAYAAAFKAGSDIKRQLALQTDINESLKLLQESANILKTRTKSVK